MQILSVSLTGWWCGIWKVISTLVDIFYLVRQYGVLRTFLHGLGNSPASRCADCHAYCSSDVWFFFIRLRFAPPDVSDKLTCKNALSTLLAKTLNLAGALRSFGRNIICPHLTGCGLPRHAPRARIRCGRAPPWRSLCQTFYVVLLSPALANSSDILFCVIIV